MNQVTLQRERAAIVKSMGDLVKAAEDEKRPLNEDEKKEFDRLQADAASLNEQIQALKATEKRRADLEELENDLRREETRRVAPPPPDSVVDAMGYIKSNHDFGIQKRYSKPKAFTKEVFGTPQLAEQAAFRAGQWARAVLFGDAEARRYCMTHEVGQASQFALGEGTNAAGGFLVPEELTQAMIDLREQYGVFRQQANVVAMGREVMEVPRLASGAAATFTGESTALTESDPAWNRVTLTAKKLGVLTRISSELAADAIIDLADWIAREFAYAFALKEDQCGFTGTGAATYGGIVGVNVAIIDGTHTAGAMDAVTANADTFGELAIADLITLMGKLPGYVMNPKWYCSKLCKELVFGKIQAAAGGNTQMDLAGALVDQFLGAPIVVSQVMPKVTTTLDNVVMLLYGDLRLAATMGVRSEIEMMTSDQRYMEYGQIAIRAIERFDINVHDLGDTTNTGPVVALIGAA